LHGIWYFIHDDLSVLIVKLSDLITAYEDDEDIEGFSLNAQDKKDIKERFKNREAVREKNTGPDIRVKDNTPNPGSE
jgi:hypothetical protein